MSDTVINAVSKNPDAGQRKLPRRPLSSCENCRRRPPHVRCLYSPSDMQISDCQRLTDQAITAIGFYATAWNTSRLLDFFGWNRSKDMQILDCERLTGPSHPLDSMPRRGIHLGCWISLVGTDPKPYMHISDCERLTGPSHQSHWILCHGVEYI
ncbi:hypothetical protein ACP4OV_027969 [Aristida adscensionis]